MKSFTGTSFSKPLVSKTHPTEKEALAWMFLHKLIYLQE
jgi:hypothetical protein